MDFSLLVQLLKPFYDWSKDTESDKRKKGKTGPFVRSFLKAGLDAQGSDRIDEICNDLLLKYYNGKRSVTQVMLDTNSHFDKDTFIDFIYDGFEWKFKEIRDKFKDYGVKIEPGNEVGSIVKIYTDIRNISQKTKERTKPKSSSKKLEMLSNDQTEIAEIIKKISEILGDMIALSIAADFEQPLGADRPFINKMSELLHTPLDQRKDKDSDIEFVFRDNIAEIKLYPYYEEFKTKHMALSDVNAKLKFYKKRYPQYSLLQELYQKGLNTELWMFYRDPLRKSCNPYFEYIEEYESLLEKCSENIVNPSF